MAKTEKTVRGVLPLFRPMPVKSLLAVAQEFEKGNEPKMDALSERMTVTEYKAAYESGKLPALYQPALIEMAAAAGFDLAINGQAKAHPASLPVGRASSRGRRGGT